MPNAAVAHCSPACAFMRAIVVWSVFSFRSLNVSGDFLHNVSVWIGWIVRFHNSLCVCNVPCAAVSIDNPHVLFHITPRRHSTASRICRGVACFPGRWCRIVPCLVSGKRAGICFHPPSRLHRHGGRRCCFRCYFLCKLEGLFFVAHASEHAVRGEGFNWMDL